MTLSAADVEGVISRAEALAADERLDEAVALLDGCAERLESERGELDERWTMWVLGTRASLLRGGGRNAEALATAAGLLNPYEDVAPPPGSEPFFAQVLLTAALAAYDIGDSAASMQLCDELVRRFGDDDDIETRVVVADAITARGITLALTGRPAEATTVYADLEAYIGATDEPDLRERLAEALRLNAEACHAAGRPDEATTSYQRVIDEFHEGESPYIDERISAARRALSGDA